MLSTSACGERGSSSHLTLWRSSAPLVFRCVDPLDPGAAFAGVGGPARTHDEYRQSIAPGVEYPQQSVHEADVRVQKDRHCPIRRLGIAMRDCQRMILVQAQQQLRVAVAEVVDQAVVKSAKAGTRIERDVFDSQSAQHLGRDVAAPCHGRIAARRGSIDAVDVGHLASFMRTQFPRRVRCPARRDQTTDVPMRRLSAR